jgi:4-amino-4-deoxy-L-arabinose transferase-like glycosyltransferase
MVILIGAILPLGILLRLLFLGGQSLWLDEATSVAVAHLNWPDLSERLTHRDPNMSLYYGLLHFWIGLGESEFTVRALSVLFAVATLPALYALGARLFGPRVGLVSALLLAVNAFHIRYAQETRSYSLLVLLTTLSSYFYCRAIERPVLKYWVVYSAASVLAVYSHLFGALVLVAQWVSVAFLRPRDIPWKGLAASIIAIGFLLLPLGVAALTIGGGQIAWIPNTEARTVLALFSALSGAGGGGVSPGGTELFAPAAAGRRLILLAYFVFSLLATLGAVREGFSSRVSIRTWRYGFLYAWLFVPIATTLAVSLVQPIFIHHYLIICLPPLVLLAAIGLSTVRSRFVYAAALTFTVALAMHGVHSYYKYWQKEDWRGATTHVLLTGRSGDTVVIYRFGNHAFNYYRRSLEVSPVSVAPVVVSGWQRLPAFHDRVWLVLREGDVLDDVRFRPINTPNAQSVQTIIADSHTMVSEWQFTGLNVLLYTRTGRTD